MCELYNISLVIAIDEYINYSKQIKLKRKGLILFHQESILLIPCTTFTQNKEL